MPVPASRLAEKNSIFSNINSITRELTATMLVHCSTNLCQKVEISDSNEVQVQLKKRTVPSVFFFFSQLKTHAGGYSTTQFQLNTSFLENSNKYSFFFYSINYHWSRLSRLVNAQEPSPALDISLTSSWVCAMATSRGGWRGKF